MEYIKKLIALLGLLFRLIESDISTCTFPDFLRTPLPNGEERYWITETQYVGIAPEWQEQLEITVEPDMITAKRRKNAHCSSPGHGKHQICAHKEVKYKLRCVEEENDGKYTVLKTEGGREDYLCYQFQQHNKNVIQLWKSGVSDSNMDFLCSSYSMHRDEWLWVAPKQEEWVPCPLSGGYDFKSFKVISQYHSYHSQEEEHCPSVWRPSRLESECIKGEGIVMNFPEANCSPFYNKPKRIQLYCWAWWVEGDLSFVVLSQANKLPQFVLRYTSFHENMETFLAFLYFSPMVPTNSQGMPKDGLKPSLEIAKIKITKSEPGDGLCYDESKLCSIYSKDGKCTNSALHHYANYCKRSCGLCDLLPSESAECHFPKEFQKQWFYFLDEKPELVNIRAGNITFSSLGDFVCKGISPSENFRRYYKMMSYYTNGCRPRYTCIELGQGTSNNVVEFRMSKSHLTDESFDLCKFQDDPFPIGNKIRSNAMKSLLPQSLTSFNNCELHGQIKVQSEPLDRNCHGTLSDWDSHSHQCKLHNILSMKLHRQCHYLIGHSSVYREFTCLASVAVQEGYNLLYTTELTNHNQFTCWVIGTYAERMSYRPWRTAKQLNHSDCASSYTYIPKPVISLKTKDEKKSQPCESTHKPPPHKPLTRKPGLIDHSNTYKISQVKRGHSTKTQSSVILTVLFASILTVLIR